MKEHRPPVDNNHSNSQSIRLHYSEKTLLTHYKVVRLTSYYEPKQGLVYLPVVRHSQL